MRSTLVILITLLSCAMVQAQQWRVVARATYLSNHQAQLYLVDSARFSYDYPSNRGSSIINDSIEYKTYAQYGGSSMSGYGLRRYFRRIYNNDNTLHYQETDIFNKVTDYDKDIDSFFYFNGKLTAHKHYKYLDVSQRFPQLDRYSCFEYEYAYSRSGMLEYEGYITNPFGKSLWGSTKHFYFYDANNRLVKDSLRLFSGMLQKWVNASVTTYSYNTSGKLSEAYERGWGLYSQQYTVDTFASYRRYDYDASGMLLKDSLYHNANQNHDYGASVHQYEYNTQGQLITDSLTEYIDSNLVYRSLAVTNYAYTPFGHVDTQSVANYNDKKTFTSRSIIRYYYGHYWPVNTNSIAQQNDLIAYPVPSSNFINLKWQADKSTTINARLVNLQGQVVKQWSDDVTGTYTKSIHVGDLPAGNYYIILEVDSNTLRKQISIQR